jgi:monoamine oxidase
MPGAYCWDQDARRLGALSNDERAEVVIENVSRFHQGALIASLRAVLQIVSTK